LETRIYGWFDVRHLYPPLWKSPKGYIFLLFIDQIYNTKAHIYRRIVVGEDNTSMLGGDSIKLYLNTVKSDYLKGRRLQSNLKSITIRLIPSTITRVD
jgi:hypothetical protein